MEEDKLKNAVPALLGSIEPHAGLLTAPPDGQLLYKVMSVENLLRSIAGRYIHFNRVDGYPDFPGVDRRDGEQAPKDRPGNAAATFAKSPDFSLADYYDRSRARTYACCFSLENSDAIWKTYGSGSEKGRVAVVFDYAKLRFALNQTLRPENSAVVFNGLRCRPIFSVNYGIVEYVDWHGHRENETRLPNPIRYTYLKDKARFGEEKEMRVSLSAMGVGQFVLNDGSVMEFPPTLHLDFDFGAAIGSGAISRILYGPECDVNFLRKELDGLRIGFAPGSDPAP